MKNQEILFRDLKDFDVAHYYNNGDLAIFVDEVGRGCIFGDVVVCAVVIPRNFFLEGVRDSKKLTDKKRRKLSQLLLNEHLPYHFGRVNSSIIDEINILNATYQGMNIALENVLKAIEPESATIVIDGLEAKINFEHENLVHGDDRSFGIACASILAKVYRDDLCQIWDRTYPGYDLAKNKGYGTKAHKEAVLNLGPSPLHRMSFLKKWGF